jgi:glycosyltransferase involved in cell wall biosynthesis
MTGAPELSVIVPTYNRAALLTQTLQSLTRQTLAPHRFEVLVCDDGSTDDTAEVVDSFVDQLAVRFFTSPHEGFRAGRMRNTGVDHARAEISVFVDSGVVLHSGCLGGHLAAHRESDEPVAVCGYVFGFAPDPKDADEFLSTVDVSDPDKAMVRLRETGRWPDVREFFYEKYGDDFADLPAPWLVYWTVNASARTSQVRAVGMFDEAFRGWGGEDLDLGYRLYLDGARVVLSRAAAALDIPHPKDFDSNMESAGENYRYMVKKYGTPVVELLSTSDPDVFFDLNDIIRERGLPACRDLLAGRRESSGR